ncbi:protein kinase family protein [Desulfosporosinus fructosivorans]|uniref:protein kinase family protein n=1 Tax=Desulfosporosinus fructosivorans TaxID=2018669 RepID=UPI00130DE591|nr:protein kinase family protein [Desulfosporosinus fructosivorans]
MTLAKDEIVKFIRTKDYLFEKFVGRGGTGRTVLLRDDILNTFFICKKYEPSDGNDKEDCFNRFIDEIKILYTLSHVNVVRIYTYFLYPEHITGYILMEHIDGTNIEDFLAWEKTETFEEIFVQLIEGFEYLERKSILHRDIKPENILVTKEGVVKIIDFGFGKKILADNNNEASILLNWPVSELPDEIRDLKYDHKTDIYFLGKMFNKLLEDNSIDAFKYQYIVDKMINTNQHKRINAFSIILQLLSTDIFQQINFSEDEIDIYGIFAEALSAHLDKFTKEEPKFESNPDIILNKLEILLAESSLEKNILNNTRLFACFFGTDHYSYYSSRDIEVSCVY